MRRGRQILLTCSLSFLLQGGCVDNPKASQEVVSPGAPETAERMGRVSPNWQINFQKQFAASPAREAYGFFSESSYADAGQYLILKDDNTATLVKVAPSTKKADAPQPLAAERLDKVTAAVRNASSLGDLEVKHFDGIRYEFVHWHKPGNNVVAQKRIYIAKPNFVAADKKHVALINAFSDLQKVTP